VDTIRHHYQEVDFFIPGTAMSAGTVLVMSGDAIHMDYYSRLGPIDPQVQRPNGGWVPASGYLVQYERLLQKDRDGTLTTTEAAILLEKFDQAEMHLFEQARELTITLLKEWLAKYKFKNWLVTQTSRRQVTAQDRIDRAAAIAEALNDTQRWHSHNRGISMDVLTRELKLVIADFGQVPELSKRLRSYHKLLTDYMLRRSQLMVIHTRGRYVSILEE
jgi:hypothetical protein